jgi:tRNA threonylcarbamoyladenosine biosynthesis protein TsaB
MLDSRHMRVLAVETSSLAGGVALLDDDRLVAEYVLDVRVTHSERLMSAVDRVLIDARWTPRELNGLAVAVGPGSFTGLRIAVSTVKGLALALDLPIAAVPTLDAMAAALPWVSLPVCPVLDARKGEVYASRYRWDGDLMRREWEYLALAPEALSARLAEPTLVVGDGAEHILSPHARRLPAPQRLPSPASVGALGLERLRRGETVAAAALAPLYLRPSEAELKRRAVPVA